MSWNLSDPAGRWLRLATIAVALSAGITGVRADDGGGDVGDRGRSHDRTSPSSLGTFGWASANGGTTGGAVGRKLDFLLQEMNREANTIGSKCQNADIAKVVVDLKSEIEKIREQIQNIE